MVRDDMDGSEMAEGNRPKLTRNLRAIDIPATGDQIKPLLFASTQFQDFFPSVRELRELSAKGIGKTIRMNDRHGWRVATILRRRPRAGQVLSSGGECNLETATDHGWEVAAAPKGGAGRVDSMAAAYRPSPRAVAAPKSEANRLRKTPTTAPAIMALMV